MEFKKFLPGFKIMSYYGTVRERKEKRHGWKGQNAFHVCITSYNLILTDQHIFRRMPWVYMILDEAHNIKNFKSQRWQDLFTFRPHRRLLLTGTPLQNNLMELWALMHFLNPVDAVGYRADFADWFSKPMDRALEDGRERDDENQERVTKLHTMLRPYLLRRMKADVEKELPAKYEHLVYCKLSKRQRFLYDEFMARSETKEILSSGNFLSVVNCLMQLRKVCNHPDLFEVRPIVTSFAMRESAVADFEDKELLIRRHLLASSPFDGIHPAFSQITSHEHLSFNASTARRLLDGSSHLPGAKDLPGEPPPRDFRTIDGFRRWSDHQKSEAKYGRWRHITYLNRQRCAVRPLYGSEILTTLASIATSRQRLFGQTSSPHPHYMETTSMLLGAVKSYRQRTDSVHPLINTFAFATPPVVARDISSLILRAVEQPVAELAADPNFDILHLPAVKLQIAFPDRSLLQYDCGKLQQLDALLKERKAGGHRALIFTQMTKVLDILEIFLNFHGYRYLRLDGSTKIEDRQKITQRFNMDTRILCFISSSRSGGVGINLTGADTVIFYDSDFNPSMDRQCEDRAHRIGQIRDVHIYRFISKHTVEESMLRKANQKRSLDDMVIRDGDFDWRKMLVSDIQMEQALDQVEDAEDAQAARYAAAEIYQDTRGEQQEFDESGPLVARQAGASAEEGAAEEDEGEEEDDGLTGLERYVLRMVEEDWSYFSEWRFK
ncbi:hypothetical protein DL93DRAFT_2076703 [Clavulina sp. PMI_390]|nr:hypothetical protein DL93DRAFT_2076703 [Clavulina sp. PMI_390]